VTICAGARGRSACRGRWRPRRPDRVSTLPTQCAGLKGGVGELAQCSSTRSRQRPGPGRRGAPAEAAALTARRPQAACSRAVSRAARAAGRSRQRGPSWPRRRPGDGQDVSGGLGGGPPVRPPGSVPATAPRPRRCPCGGLGGRARVAPCGRQARRPAALPRWCCPCRGRRRAGPRRPGRWASRCRRCRAAALDPGRSAGLLVRAIRACRAACDADSRRARRSLRRRPPGGLGRQRGRSGRCRGCRPPPGQRARGPGIRRGVGGAAGRVRGGVLVAVP